MTAKTIYLLLGPKGSGKTFIGEIYAKEFNVKFLRVEDWAKVVKRKRQFDNTAYLQEVFTAIEDGVRNALESYPEVVFESTGITGQFDTMLASLERDFKVVTIGIQTESELCLNRVKSRDQSIHINIPDDQVKMINQQVIEKSINTDYQVQNSNSTYQELVNEISGILSCERTKNNQY